MLRAITVTRSQGPDDRSDARHAVRAASLIPILGVKVAISLLLTEGGEGGLRVGLRIYPESLNRI